MLRRVYQGRSADGVRDWLKRNGIQSFLRPAGSEEEDYAWGSVWVLRDDEEAARALLLHPAPQKDAAGSWSCPHCGRSLDVCWCETEQP